MDQSTDSGIDAIPIEWMVDWVSGQRDPAKAAVVNEMISSFIIQKKFPELAQRLDAMQRDCNPIEQNEKNANLIAEKIEEKVISVIEQLNMGDGHQFIVRQAKY